VRLVAFDGSRSLDLPIRDIRLGFNATVWTVVAVPKTSMNKDDLTEPWEDEVWLAGQIMTVKPKPVAERVYELSYHEFRRGIGAADTRHAMLPLFASEGVGHYISPARANNRRNSLVQGYRTGGTFGRRRT